MVTHDVALKNFANRVVRMLDGKIHQITEQSLESRLLHLKNLREIVSSYEENNDKIGEGLLGVREGISMFFS